MGRTKLLLVGLLLLLPTALAQNAPGASTKSVTVTATGTAYGTPDEAGFDTGVSVLNADVQVAIDQVNERVSSLMSALKTAGVAERDVRTVNFNVLPEPHYDNQGQVTQMRYRVTNTLHVTVRDTARLGALLGASVTAGANEVSSVAYSFSSRGVLERQARRQAMARARQKAAQLAKFGQTQLGKVRRITERTSAPQPFESRVFAESAELAGDSLEVPVASGQLAVTVSVQVTFGLK